MKAIIEISQELILDVMKYKEENEIATLEEAMNDLARKGLQRVTERDPYMVHQVAKYTIRNMKTGTEFSVHDLAANDSPNTRKYLGRRLAEDVKESPEFAVLRKTQQGLTIYIRTEFVNAPKLP